MSDINEKLNKRMSGEEVIEPGMVVKTMTPVSVTIKELKEVLAAGKCTCKEHLEALKICLKKNPNDATVVVLDQADLKCMLEGGHTEEELDANGKLCKVHMPVNKTIPPTPPKK